MVNDAHYLQRRHAEITLLSRCLAQSEATLPAEPRAALEQKLHLAAKLRAQQCLQHWAVTETAPHPSVSTTEGSQPAYQPARTFSYNYQRADLEVHGAPVYPRLHAPTLYTSCGMSAIHSLLSALLQLNARLDIRIAADCYDETRELFASFAPQITARADDGLDPELVAPAGTARLLWLDSSSRASGLRALRATRRFDLVVFDSTCAWRGSRRVQHVIEWARSTRVPLVLVRSHLKLDSLGIEYARLGSIVAAMRPVPSRSAPWTGNVWEQLQRMVRLTGAAAVPSHLAPFAQGPEYEACCRRRTAALMRSTRLLTRALRRAFPDTIATYQHSLYLTLDAGPGLGVDDAIGLADDMAGALASRGLPVRHAGSFGFDFVAIDRFPHPDDGHNLIRVAGADLPLQIMERVAGDLAAWWSIHQQRGPASRIRKHGSAR
jgi:hypothetical protein